jgi:hypothetical protein
MPVAIGNGNVATSSGLSYYASIVEQEWAPPVANKLCQIAQRQSQTNASERWITYAAAARGPTPRVPFANESEILSRFVDQDGCEEYIEPLTGLARHPVSRDMGCRGRWNLRKHNGVDKYNIGYLIPANRCGGGGDLNPGTTRGMGGQCRRISGTIKGAEGVAVDRSRRNLYYDLGASVWGKNIPEQHLIHGSGLGSSLQLISKIYERNCITFDRIWAWEAKEWKPKDFWQRVPLSVRAKLHFYNVPISETPSGSGSSFLRTLELTARPQDFVVVKVDIDTPDLEKMIVSTIVSTPRLAALVDELYFEYHFHFGADARGPWGFTQNTNKSDTESYKPDTVDDALGLMRRLREVGIRSHFWI